MKRKRFLTNLLAFSMLLIMSTVYAEADTLRFGVYTSDKPTAMYAKFKPILNYLQQHMQSNGINVDFEFKVYSTYDKAIDALVKGDCDFSRFGPSSYIIAKERNPNVRLLVMEHKKNKKLFNGVFIVPKDSDVRSIKDIRGKTFAFGNKNSTIGRYLSQAELVKKGLRAESLKNFAYLGRHDKVALAVALGMYEAGVVKENTYKKYAKSKGLKKIGVFPIVTKPWVVRAGLDETDHERRIGIKAVIPQVAELAHQEVRIKLADHHLG